jgi:hypothetical protein
MRLVSLLLFCILFFTFAACVQAQCPGGNCQLQPQYKIVYPTPIREFIFGSEIRVIGGGGYSYPAPRLPGPPTMYGGGGYAPSSQGYYPSRYYRR